jgi:hypothetical protein
LRTGTGAVDRGTGPTGSREREQESALVTADKFLGDSWRPFEMNIASDNWPVSQEIPPVSFPCPSTGSWCFILKGAAKGSISWQRSWIFSNVRI